MVEQRDREEGCVISVREGEREEGCVISVREREREEVVNKTGQREGGRGGCM